MLWCSCSQRQPTQGTAPWKTHSRLSSFLQLGFNCKIINLFNIPNCPEWNVPHPHHLTISFKCQAWFDLLTVRWVLCLGTWIICLPLPLYICERVSVSVPWRLLSLSDPRCGTMRQGTLSEPWRVTRTLYKTSLLTRQGSCWLHVQQIWASSCGTSRGLSASEQCMVRTDVQQQQRQLDNCFLSAAESILLCVSRPRPQCFFCSHHAKWRPYSVCLKRQDHEDVGGCHWVRWRGWGWLSFSSVRQLPKLTVSYFQVLREDVHRPQGVGQDGASQPGRLLDRQLLQRPDGARLGGGLQGVQSRVAGARTCGGVHRLGPWECSPHHPGSHRLRGAWPVHWLLNRQSLLSYSFHPPLIAEQEKWKTRTFPFVWIQR